MAPDSIQTVRIATVGWGSLNSSASLYGSRLTLKASGDAHLANHLMPSGTTIQEWYSSTDYQAVRDTPSLPLLHQGRTYRLDPRFESIPEDTLGLEVRFFDRFNDPMDDVVLYPPDFEFEYPAGSHYYTIALTNGGCETLSFTSLTLLEVRSDD